MNTLEKVKASTNGSQRATADPSQENGVAGDMSQGDPNFSLRSLRAEAEIYAISRTLEYTGWNRRRAAKLLKVSRVTVHRWLKQGQLRAYHVGPRAVRINRQDLQRVIVPTRREEVTMIASIYARKSTGQNGVSYG